MMIDELIERGSSLFLKENQGKLKKDLFTAVKETLERQIEKCALYRRYCEKRGFNHKLDLKSAEDFNKIPYLTTRLFKQKQGRPKDLLLCPESEILAWIVSSGTSGDPSIVGRDKVNRDRMIRSYEVLKVSMGFLEDYAWALLFMPPMPSISRDHSTPVTMNPMIYTTALTFSVPPEKRIYCLKPADNQDSSAARKFELDSTRTFGFLKSSPSKLGKGFIGGSAPFMYSTLKAYHDQTGKTFTAGADSCVQIGGGWKTFKGEEVPKSKFRKEMSEILGVPEENIRDRYAFSETDAWFLECEHHNLHSYPWADVIVRDVETLEPLDVDERGLVNIINPMAYSYAGVSVLQDDIARIVMEDGCPCGRHGKVIEVLGRAEGAEARGCGAQIAELAEH